MKHEALKQIENQDYWERERERGTFDSRNMQWKKKKIPHHILNLFVIREIKRNIFLGEKKKKKTYINMKICRGREKKKVFLIQRGWGRGKVGEKEETFYVLVIEKGICNQQVA